MYLLNDLVGIERVKEHLLSPILSQSIPSKNGWFLKSSIPFCPNRCSILQQSLQTNKTHTTNKNNFDHKDYELLNSKCYLKLQNFWNCVEKLAKHIESKAPKSQVVNIKQTSDSSPLLHILLYWISPHPHTLCIQLPPSPPSLHG